MKDELAKRLVQGLKEAGINFVTYLPETRLSQIVPLIRDDPEMELVAVSSEQEAVTIAVGATLGGKQAAVYMENTGIYVSSYSLLVTGKQLGVPILLVVGFLGGVPDQRNSFLYATIGNHTIPVLQGLGIEYKVLEDGEKLEIKISDAVRAANALRAPYVIRHECLELLAKQVSDQLIVTSQSGQRIEWSHLSKHEGNLLVGMMGCAIGVATGLALALPHRKVIALDSDGSVLLSLFNLATLGNLQPKNLVIYVFDNGVYSGSRISYPTATSGNADLEAMARGAGINRNELAFFVCKVEESLLHREIPRPNTDLAENKYTFVRYLERTEEKTIPFVGRG